MTQASSPATAPAAPERAALEPGFLPWLLRRLRSLRPRTWKHWALYAFLFLVVLFLLYEWRSSISYSAQVLVTDVVVTDEELAIGISPYYPDRLDFGDLPRGSSATLTVALQNDGRIPMRVFIVATGDISRFIRISDAFFILDPGQAKEVEFSAGIPGTAQPKQYSGKVYVFRTPWLPWP